MPFEKGKKPVGATPFKPGYSGNPAGRPKGSLNRSTIVQQWLDIGELIRNPITKEIEKLTQEDIITLMQISQARKGNTRAYKMLMDSAYGRPRLTTEHTGGEVIPTDNDEIRKLDTGALLRRRAAIRERLAQHIINKPNTQST